MHKSVLLDESITALSIVTDGIYVDGTFGRGGHSREILKHLGPNGRLLAIDKDLDAIEYAKQHFAHDPRFKIVHGSFANVVEIAKNEGIYQKINGILLDLGVSSPQLDEAQRGFSFMQAGPLDMRMDVTQKLDAATFIQTASVTEMTQIFRDYGEERFAGRIARAIEAERAINPILTTDALAKIVSEANPKWEKHKHPATRVFQAIRIHVNHELSDLTHGLTKCIDVLGVGGRLVVISFHSLEDRIVKRFMRDTEQGIQPPKGVPLRSFELKTGFKRVGKAIKPLDAEIVSNVRSRSAILRIGEKIA
jgi:16S rRNA (cytosine1402-N4)-methyltransferase